MIRFVIINFASLDPFKKEKRESLDRKEEGRLLLNLSLLGGGVKSKKQRPLPFSLSASYAYGVHQEARLRLIQLFP